MLAVAARYHVGCCGWCEPVWFLTLADTRGAPRLRCSLWLPLPCWWSAAVAARFFASLRRPRVSTPSARPCPLVRCWGLFARPQAFRTVLLPGSWFAGTSCISYEFRPLCFNYFLTISASIGRFPLGWTPWRLGETGPAVALHTVVAPSTSPIRLRVRCPLALLLASSLLVAVVVSSRVPLVWSVAR